MEHAPARHRLICPENDRLGSQSRKRVTGRHNVQGIGVVENSDTKEAPGKRQSMLDFGIIDGSVTDFMQGKFVREDRATGDYVFDLTYKYQDDTSRHRCWIDPQTRVVKKREWYSQDGKLKATFYYRDIKEVADGVYLPSTIEVRNVEGKSAGTTAYRSISANKGNISDSAFSL